jgi:hypothetical protein
MTKIMNTYAKSSVIRIKEKLCPMLSAFCIFLIFNFSFLIFNCEANATIRYVSPTGNNIPPYLTWEDAANSIQDCIDVSEFGDTIYVANGVYEEQVVMINGLSLIGAGTDSCVIDTRNLVTSQNFHSVEVTDSCLFTGFQVMVYNNSTWGHGIAASGKCLVTLNKISYGRYGISNDDSGPIIYKNSLVNVSQGVRLFNSNALVRKNMIYIDPNSQAVVVSGIYMEAFDNNYYPIIDSNYIETSSEGIRKSFGTRSTIRNNTIILNRVGARGIRIGSSDSVKVYNNLIIAESGRDGIHNINIPYLQIFNNFATGNFDDQQNLAFVITVGTNNIAKHNVVTNAERGVEAWGTGNLVFQYNNIWNNDVNYSGFTPDTTNLSVDPMIVNDDTTQGDLDFHLQKFSPLIDAGDPEMFDLDSSRIDIGLYGGLYGETYKYLDLPPRPPRNLTGEIDSGMITIRWNPNTEADFGHYKLFRDTTTGFTPDTTNFIMSLTDTFYTHIYPPGIEKYYYKLTAVDNQGNESQPSEELKVIITSLDTGEPTIISNYILYQNYPNPFNPSTKIGYKLKERGYVKLYVYSVTGELVSVLVNQNQEAGYYEVEFTVAHPATAGSPAIASGIYIYQIMVKNENNLPVFTDMKKMILIK